MGLGTIWSLFRPTTFRPKSGRRAVRENFDQKAKVVRPGQNSLIVLHNVSMTPGEKMSAVRQELWL